MDGIPDRGAARRPARAYEARLGLGGLSPLRSLLWAAPLHALLWAGILVALGAASPGEGAALVVADLAPGEVLVRFLPALCLLPLAASLPPWGIAALYLAAAAASPLLSFWGGHPYQLGIAPGPLSLSAGDWFGGVPLMLFGAALALHARRDRHGPPAAQGDVLKAFVMSLFALVALGPPLVHLLGGGTLDPGALVVLGILLSGVLKAAGVAGVAAGLAAYLLARGAAGPGRAALFLALGALMGPLSWRWGASEGLQAAWTAGFLLFGAAVALDRPVPALRLRRRS